MFTHQVSGVLFRSDEKQKHLIQNNPVLVRVSKCTTDNDESVILPSLSINTVSGISGVSVFLTDRERNVFLQPT